MDLVYFLGLALVYGLWSSAAFSLAPKALTAARRSLLMDAASESPTERKLTRKEYLIAVRNRLYAIDEQLWLHDYAKAHPNSNIKPLSYNKREELKMARASLLDEYPAVKLMMDMSTAHKRNLTFAEQYLQRALQQFQRQLPLSMDHVNQIAVLSYSGSVINLMRGQGAVHQRLLPSNLFTDPGVKRQFQHPAFSASGKYVAFAEMHFKGDSSAFVRSDALVFSVPTAATSYGDGDLIPVFDSGELPGAPFFIRFSPDEENLVMLCTSPTSDSYTVIAMIPWKKFYRKDSWAGQGSLSNFAPRAVFSLLQGNPVFFSYTTADPGNATIVAHCTKEVPDPQTKAMVTERAVWLLQRQDTGGVQDFKWTKLCDSGAAPPKWTTPICHSAGGGDNVLVVEDNFLVSKALSRWKRDADGALKSKRLLPVKGQVQFLVAPDNSRCVVLQEDINVGHYLVTVIEGEDALDPASPATGVRYELPNPKLTVAFWFSPDSTKLLCLTASGKSREDVAAQRSNFKVGLNSEMQWAVFNFPLQELKEYDVFKPTPYFMKTYVPFFSQYAQVYNPWAPDSRSFIFMTTAGLSHTPLVGSKYCLGMDKWQNQGATFGTWSRQ